MTDREDRSDRLRKRFERGGEDADADDPEDTRSSTSADAATGANAGTDASSQDGNDEGDENGGPSVKDRPSVLMYLPEETRQELDIRFDELNARHKREYGEPLEKNRDYYPAVIQAGLEGESVEDVLGL